MLNTQTASKNFYQRWESCLDSAGFIASEIGYLMVRQVSLLSTVGMGSLLAASANAITLPIINKILQPATPLKRTAITAMVLGFNALALPFAAARLSAHTVIRVTSETALRIAITGFILKAGSGLIAHIFFREWATDELIALSQKGLNDYPLDQKKRFNELFMKHQIPPQERTYKAEELPGLPEGELTSSDVHWCHRILSLQQNSAPKAELLKKFYEAKLSPIGKRWIELDIPESVESVEAFAFPWFQNFFEANLDQWKALSRDLQEAFNAKFSKKLPPFIKEAKAKEAPPKPELAKSSLLGRATKNINWRKVGVVSLIALAALTAAAPTFLPIFYSNEEPQPSDANDPVEFLKSEILTPHSSNGLVDLIPASLPPFNATLLPISPIESGAKEAISFDTKPLFDLEASTFPFLEASLTDFLPSPLPLFNTTLLPMSPTIRNFTTPQSLEDRPAEESLGSFWPILVPCFFVTAIGACATRIFSKKGVAAVPVPPPALPNGGQQEPHLLEDKGPPVENSEPVIDQPGTSEAAAAQKEVQPESSIIDEKQAGMQPARGSKAENESWGQRVVLNIGAAATAVADAASAAHAKHLKEHNHESKLEKYQVILDEYKRLLKEKGYNLRKLTRLARNKIQKIENSSALNKNISMYNSFLRVLEVLINEKDPKEIYKDARQRKLEFITAFRSLVQSEGYARIKGYLYNPQTDGEKRIGKLLEEKIGILRFGQDMADIIFKAQIPDYQKKMVDLFASHGQEKPGSISFTRKDYVQMVSQTNEKIHGAPIELRKSKAALAFQKLEGAGRTKDFIGTENVPYIRNHMIFKKDSEVHQIDYCRHGCPTLPESKPQAALSAAIRGVTGTFSTLFGSTLTNAFGSAISSVVDVSKLETEEMIAPEFEEMLFAMRNRKEAVFYANHQRRWKQSGVEDESIGVKALEKLEERSSNFYLISQPVEGDLFERKGKHRNIFDFKELKLAIRYAFKMDRVSDQHRLPAVILNDPALKKEYLGEMQSILDQVHDIFFSGRKRIDFSGKDPIDSNKPYPLREWQLFIETFYAFQRLHLIFFLPEHTTEKFKITKLLTVCKDFLDRGGNESQIQDILSYYMLSDNPDDKWFEETAYNLLSAPILVKKQEVIPRRIVPGLAFAQHCEALPDESKKKLRDVVFGDGWAIDQVKLLRPVAPSKSSAKGKGKA